MISRHIWDILLLLYFLYHAHQLLFRGINQTDVAYANLRLEFSITKTQLHLFSSWFAGTTYSPANWTIPTLPSTSRIAMYTRRLRSMSSNEDGLLGSGTGPRKYLCNDCSRTFALKASLLRHKAFECNKGRQPYERQSQDEYDRSRKSKKKHVCSRCNRVYAFFTSLWRHQKYECGVEPKFICPICKGRFAQKSNLDRHVRSKHWTVKISKISRISITLSCVVDQWIISDQCASIVFTIGVGVTLLCYVHYFTCSEELHYFHLSW